MNYFVLLFFKVTAFIPQLLFYRRRRIYAHGNRPSLKGAILISNHYSIYDVPFIMFSFLFRTIYFVAGEQLYKKRMLAWWVRSIGGVKCNRDAKDMTWIDRCERLLKKGKTVLIFPQSRLSQDNSAPFNQNFAVLALKSRCPILPIYVSGNYGKGRSTIVIGRKMSITEHWDSNKNSRDNLNEIAAIYKDIIDGYSQLV